MSPQAGQSALYAVLLVPLLLLLVTAMVIDGGHLVAARSRLQGAADLSALAGAGAIDTVGMARQGRVYLDPGQGTSLARSYLERNLGASEPAAADQAAAIAQSAEVDVLNNVPAVEPLTGRTVDRPTVAIRFWAPVVTQLLHLAGIDDRVWLRVTALAEVRT